MINNANDHKLLTVEDLVVEFPINRQSKIHAVSNTSFNIGSGETMGLVGESGCGKSTLARTIVQLQKPTAGRIWFDGEELTRCNGKRLRILRPNLQMIFQDAYASLNPGRRVGRTIAEPLKVIGGIDRNERMRMARNLMREVGLDPRWAFEQRPFEFSGGQCQRISIARALITQPKFLICDEPVSSLDVSIQAQILNLLEKMKARYGLTMLFISHDLAVVKNICDRVAVMYLGKLCEIADSESLYRSPRHPYSAALLASVPNPDPEEARTQVNLQGAEIPTPASPPSGCRFRTRCNMSQSRCADIEPVLIETQPGRLVACHYPLP